MLTCRKKEDGFTLIEIMVVLVILGVLATISVPVYSNYVRKAKINEAVTNVGAYANAARIYRMEHGDWPEATTTLDVQADEYYFTITWAKDTTKNTFVITITPTDDIDIEKTDTGLYTMDSDYKGVWSGTLITNYANYLIRPSSS